MCILVIFVVVAYNVLVIQPFNQQQWVSVARYRRNGYFESSEIDYMCRSPWTVSSVGVFMQIHGN